MTPSPDPAGVELERPRRVSQSEIIRALLERGSTEHDSVTLTRNARGIVQIEVVVRTGNEAGVATIEDAAELARTVYEELATRYPYVEPVSPAKS